MRPDESGERIILEGECDQQLARVGLFLTQRGCLSETEPLGSALFGKGLDTSPDCYVLTKEQSILVVDGLFAIIQCFQPTPWVGLHSRALEELENLASPDRSTP